MNNDHNSYDNIKTALFADCLANSKEIFQLIDLIFPLDSCRHYEVLPLRLEGNDLTLGMLNPSNEESLKFVNSIANVFHYNLTINLIDLQTHQILLTSYPQKSQPQTQANLAQDRNKTVVDGDLDHDSISLNQGQQNRRRLADSAPTIISEPKEEVSNPKSFNPGLEDLPADLDFLRDLDLTPQSSTQSNQTHTDSTATLFEIHQEFLNQKPAQNLDDKPTVIGSDPAELLAQSLAENKFEEAQISALIAETQAPKKLETANFMPQLKSHLSWQDLLEQAFEHDTETINLTRHNNCGSIIAYLNKEPQSSLDELPLPTFCSLMDEIKQMARIPQNTSNHPKKVVLERIYQEERILLRLEFSTQDDDEIVIVQILRAQALKDYEQKQMDRISEQALQLAQQLEKTLRKIQACFDSAEITNLTELQTVQSRINHQLRLLDKI